jgi:hypothetical protein
VVHGNLHLVLDFGSSLVHNDGVLLFFHLDNLQLRANIRGFMKAYHFSILKEWKGINCLPITNGKDSSKTVSESCIVKFFILLDTCIIDFYLADRISCFILL